MGRLSGGRIEGQAAHREGEGLRPLPVQFRRLNVGQAVGLTAAEQEDIRLQRGRVGEKWQVGDVGCPLSPQIMAEVSLSRERTLTPANGGQGRLMVADLSPIRSPPPSDQRHQVQELSFCNMGNGGSVPMDCPGIGCLSSQLPSWGLWMCRKASEGPSSHA